MLGAGRASWLHLREGYIEAASTAKRWQRACRPRFRHFAPVVKERRAARRHLAESACDAVQRDNFEKGSPTSFARERRRFIDTWNTMRRTGIWIVIGWLPARRVLRVSLIVLRPVHSAHRIVSRTATPS